MEQEERGKQQAILPCQVQYDVSLLKLVAWRRAWFKLNLQIFGYFIFGPRERERESGSRGVLLPIRWPASLIRFVINTSAAVGAGKLPLPA